MPTDACVHIDTDMYTYMCPHMPKYIGIRVQVCMPAHVCTCASDHTCCSTRMHGHAGACARTHTRATDTSAHAQAHRSTTATLSTRILARACGHHPAQVRHGAMPWQREPVRLHTACGCSSACACERENVCVRMPVCLHMTVCPIYVYVCYVPVQACVCPWVSTCPWAASAPVYRVCHGCAQVCQAHRMPVCAHRCLRMPVCARMRSYAPVCAMCTCVPTRVPVYPVCPRVPCAFSRPASARRCPRPRCGWGCGGGGAGAGAGRWGARRRGRRSAAAGARGGASPHRPPNFH